MQLCVIFRHVKALVLSSVFIPALVTSGEVFQFVAFCQRYPSVLLHIMSFSLASAIGQVGFHSTKFSSSQVDEVLCDDRNNATLRDDQI